MSFTKELRSWFFRTGAPTNTEGKKINLEDGSRPDQDVFEKMTASHLNFKEAADRAKTNTGAAIEAEVGTVAVTSDVKAKANTTGFEADRTLVTHAGQLPTVAVGANQAITGTQVPLGSTAFLDVTADATSTRNNFVTTITAALLGWYQAVSDWIDAADARITTNEGDIVSLDGRVTTNEGDITTNAGDITTNAGAITTLDGRVTTNEGDITSLDARVTVNEGDITTLTAGTSYPWVSLGGAAALASIVSMARISGEDDSPYTLTHSANSYIRYCIVDDILFINFAVTSTLTSTTTLTSGTGTVFDYRIDCSTFANISTTTMRNLGFISITGNVTGGGVWMMKSDAGNEYVELTGIPVVNVGVTAAISATVVAEGQMFVKLN